jgi:hypothetical protein
MSEWLHTFTKPEPASEPQAPRCDLLTTEECEGMDDTFSFITSSEPFRWTPAQRKARAEFEEAARAGELRRIPTVFGELV